MEKFKRRGIKFFFFPLFSTNTNLLCVFLRLDGYTRSWKKVGTISPSGMGGQSVKLDSVVWAGGKMVPGVGLGRRAVYRVVTAIGPPFVMHAPLQQDRQCLRGIQCYQMKTTNKDNITMILKDTIMGVNKGWANYEFDGNYRLVDGVDYVIIKLLNTCL